MSAPISIRAARRFARNLYTKTDDIYLKWHLRTANVTTAPTIHSYTTPEELDALFRLAEDCPEGAKALEIGSHLGASTCFIGAALQQRGGHLYCVDTWHNETMPEGEQDTFEEFKRNTSGLNGVLTLLRKRSDKLTDAEVEKPLDLVFLDGDHSYESTKADFELTSPWVGELGVLAFHDCVYFEGVSRVIGEALAGRQWRIGGHVGNLLWLKRAKWRR